MFLLLIAIAFTLIWHNCFQLCRGNLHTVDDLKHRGSLFFKNKERKKSPFSNLIQNADGIILKYGTGLERWLRSQEHLMLHQRTKFHSHHSHQLTAASALAQEIQSSPLAWPTQGLHSLHNKDTDTFFFTFKRESSRFILSPPDPRSSKRTLFRVHDSTE